MPDLIDNFWRRVQQEKEKQQSAIGYEMSIRVCLHTQVKGHQRQPEDKPNADDIPKVMPDAGNKILDGKRPCMANRLLDQAQSGANQEGIHRTEQKASNHAKRQGNLSGKHQQKSKPHHGDYGHPASDEGLSSFMEGAPIEQECFSQNV